MGVILDTDVIIQGEKGEFSLTDWLRSRAEDTFLIAAITVAELWHGVERAEGRRRQLRERYLNAVLSVLPVLPYREETARIHARIWAHLQRQGTMIGYYDLIVAATATPSGVPACDIQPAAFRTRS